MTNHAHRNDGITHATWILERAGYFVVQAADENPIINLVAVNEKHTLFIRVKKVQKKREYATAEDVAREQVVDVDMLSHIKKPENTFMMLWVMYDDTKKWERFFLNRGNLLEIYETI
jgi:hypothetical protein